MRTFREIYMTDEQTKDEITDLIGEDILVGDKVWTHIDVRSTEREHHERMNLPLAEPGPSDDMCSLITFQSLLMKIPNMLE